ncbi:hypothetical protein SCHPADRAFT_887879 [Schizopora paradoxa]|uniref:RNI-like protein n=1 Tax=Schizopora paradoxa TaxID=27342 RepID=A0A0H2SGN4_9AGAM|nr:hypothetical protein SCHPADRAFT_887879 [Schizopora paradoxa]
MLTTTNYAAIVFEIVDSFEDNCRHRVGSRQLIKRLSTLPLSSKQFIIYHIPSSTRSTNLHALTLHWYTASSEDVTPTFLIDMVEKVLQASSPSESDKVLADLVNNRSLTYEGLTTLLQAIKNGGFDSKDVTIDQAEDVLLREVNKRYDTLMRNESASTVKVPRIVIQGVIDILSDVMDFYDSWKDKFISDTFDKFEGTLREERSMAAKSTLESMSLVHPSWTLMAYRALGQLMDVPVEKVEGRDSPWAWYLQNPLYGAWTRTLKFKAKFQISEFDAKQRSFFVSKLTLRFTHLRKLAISFSLFTEDFSDTIQLLFRSTTSLEDISLLYDVTVPTGLQIGIIEIPDAVIESLSHLPHLRKIRMSYSGNNILGMELPAQFEPLVSNLSLKELRVNFRTSLSPNGYELSALRNVSSMLWRRVGDHEFALKGLRFANLRGWGRQTLVRETQRRQKQDRLAKFKHLVGKLTILDIGTIRLWETDEYEISHCEELRELSVYMMDPAEVMENFLNSIPRSLEQLTIMFSAEENISFVDRALGNCVLSGVLPKLRDVRVLRLHTDRTSFNNTRIMGQPGCAHLAPLLSKFCEQKGIELAIAQ